jgi:DNA processing protein
VDEVAALLALSHVPSLGSIKTRLLLKHFDSAVTAFNADPKDLAQLPGFSSHLISGLVEVRTSQSWQYTLDLVLKEAVTLIPFYDQKYPKGLLDLPDYPLLLYVKGSILPQDNQGIAVIGTRQASLYGRHMAETLSRDLSHQGFTIVSGLARGIDTIAHQSTLNAKRRTIAVIGSGLANIYPHENNLLAQTIASEGVLISEFPMATPPDRQNFPQRNRLVAAMTRATLLIEAPQKSGAMITVNRALSLKRSVFAIPGRADAESFKGNHSLIKTGQAQLVENVDDIVSTFSDFFRPASQYCDIVKNEIPLEPEERQFLQAIPAEEVSIEELIEYTKLPVMKLNVLLMSLVLKRAIREFPGKVFKKVS